MPGGVAWPERARFILLVILIVGCFLWGGGSRVDIPGLLFLYPLAIAILAGIMVLPGKIRWDCIAVPLALLGALASLLALQLVPLPSSLWLSLPGRAQFAEQLLLGGAGDAWRPLSVAPDLTLASLIGLGPCFAALIGFASIPEQATRRLLAILLIGVAVGVLLGIGQLAGGPHSAFYRYSVTHEGAAVGFFANRNHSALLLVMAFPMLALWSIAAVKDQRARRVRLGIAAAAAIALIPMLAVTGSRAGLIIAPLGVALGWWLFRANRTKSAVTGTQPYRYLVRGLAVLVPLAMLALAFGLSRAEALQRLIGTDVSEESRIAAIPTLWRILVDFLPFGTGFGAFDPVFRRYEPDSMLDPTYLNHAHNDLFELVIVGGIPAFVIALLFLVWVVRRAVAIRHLRRSFSGASFALLGFMMIALTLLASLVDYPLRTPLQDLFFCFACGWLAQARGRTGEHSRVPDPPLRSSA